MWNGIGASFLLSQIAAGVGALAGKDYSGFLQTVLGIESLPAYADLLFGKQFDALKTYFHDRKTIRRSNEPIEIFSK